jgi:hypothetical protein
MAIEPSVTGCPKCTMTVKSVLLGADPVPDIPVLAPGDDSAGLDARIASLGESSDRWTWRRGERAGKSLRPG